MLGRDKLINSHGSRLVDVIVKYLGLEHFNSV